MGWEIDQKSQHSAMIRQPCCFKEQKGAFSEKKRNPTFRYPFCSFSREREKSDTTITLTIPVFLSNTTFSIVLWWSQDKRSWTTDEKSQIFPYLCNPDGYVLILGEFQLFILLILANVLGWSKHEEVYFVIWYWIAVFTNMFLVSGTDVLNAWEIGFIDSCECPENYRLIALWEEIIEAHGTNWMGSRTFTTAWSRPAFLFIPMRGLIIYAWEDLGGVRFSTYSYEGNDFIIWEDFDKSPKLGRAQIVWHRFFQLSSSEYLCKPDNSDIYVDASMFWEGSEEEQFAVWES